MGGIGEPGSARKLRFVEHVGLHIERPAGGAGTCRLKVADRHFNATGVVHGGVLFTLVDTAMGAALYSTLEPAQLCATIEVKINYFKPVREGTLVCTSVIVSKGKSVANLDASVHVGDVLVARANGSFAIFARKGAAPQDL
ncbi:MAG: PaaI family thioesterase [Caldimonas sp.]